MSKPFFPCQYFVLITATASTKLRKKIIKMLNMSDVKTVRMTPDKENVKYVVQRAKKLSYKKHFFGLSRI